MGVPGTFTYMISFNTYKGLCLDIVIILIVTGEKKEGQREGWTSHSVGCGAIAAGSVQDSRGQKAH